MDQVYYHPSGYGHIARPQRQPNLALGLVVFFIIFTLLTLSAYSSWNHPYAQGITFTPPVGGVTHRTDLCGRILPGTSLTVGDYIINHKGHLLLVTKDDITVLGRDGVVKYSMIRDSTILSEPVPEIVSISYTCAHVYNVETITGEAPIVANTIAALREFESDSGAKQTCMFITKKDNCT